MPSVLGPSALVIGNVRGKAFLVQPLVSSELADVRSAQHDGRQAGGHEHEDRVDPHNFKRPRQALPPGDVDWPLSDL